MIIFREPVVQLGMTADYKHKILQWNGAIVNMKEPSGILGKYDLNKCEMRKVVM